MINHSLTMTGTRKPIYPSSCLLHLTEEAAMESHSKIVGVISCGFCYAWSVHAAHADNAAARQTES